MKTISNTNNQPRSWKDKRTFRLFKKKLFKSTTKKELVAALLEDDEVQTHVVTTLCRNNNETETTKVSGVNDPDNAGLLRLKTTSLLLRKKLREQLESNAGSRKTFADEYSFGSPLVEDFTKKYLKSLGDDTQTGILLSSDTDLIDGLLGVEDVQDHFVAAVLSADKNGKSVESPDRAEQLRQKLNSVIEKNSNARKSFTKDYGLDSALAQDFAQTYVQSLGDSTPYEDLLKSKPDLAAGLIGAEEVQNYFIRTLLGNAKDTNRAVYAKILRRKFREHIEFDADARKTFANEYGAGSPLSKDFTHKFLRYLKEGDEKSELFTSNPYLVPIILEFLHGDDKLRQQTYDFLGDASRTDIEPLIVSLSRNQSNLLFFANALLSRPKHASAFFHYALPQVLAEQDFQNILGKCLSDKNNSVGLAVLSKIFTFADMRALGVAAIQKSDDWADLITQNEEKYLASLEKFSQSKTQKRFLAATLNTSEFLPLIAAELKDNAAHLAGFFSALAQEKKVANIMFDQLEASPHSGMAQGRDLVQLRNFNAQNSSDKDAYDTSKIGNVANIAKEIIGCLTSDEYLSDDVIRRMLATKHLALKVYSRIGAEPASVADAINSFVVNNALTQTKSPAEGTLLEKLVNRLAKDDASLHSVIQGLKSHILDDTIKTEFRRGAIENLMEAICQKPELTSLLLSVGVQEGEKFENQFERIRSQLAAIQIWRDIKEFLPQSLNNSNILKDLLAKVKTQHDANVAVIGLAISDKRLNLNGAVIRYINQHDVRTILKEILLREDYYFESDSNTPTIIDCGANFGLGLYYYKKLYPQSRIIAFEPGRRAFATLKHNVDIAGWKDVTIRQSAVGAEDAKASFFDPQKMPMGGTLTKRLSEDSFEGQRYDVNVERLSEYITDTIDFLKLDIEGSEELVLDEIEGKMHLVKSIFIEVHYDKTDRSSDGRLKRILDRLDKAGFVYRVAPAVMSNTPSQPMKRAGDRQSMAVWAKRIPGE